MDRVTLKMMAKQRLSGNWGTAIAAEIIFSLIFSAISSLAFGMNIVNIMNHYTPSFQNVTGLLNLIIIGPMTVGICYLYLRIIRNMQFDFSEMFSGFKNFGTNCGAGVLVSLFTFLWSLLFIVPGIVKGLSYSMTYYILADRPNLTASEAINESQRMMYGHKGELFVLYLSYIGWYLLVPFTLGFLLLYVVPYQRATVTEFYEYLKSLDTKNNTQTAYQESNNADGGPTVL